MGMIETLSRREAVGLLLASFPASATDGGVVALAYLVATEGFSDFAVRSAVESYIKGAVPNQERRFAPSAALFADTARKFEIAPSTVDFVVRHPAALEHQDFPESYRLEMQRRVQELFPSLTSAMSESS
ncbi:hypothetical protein [Devosia sp. CN2-171]|uniref:hypothetical protein n=1 Tax=Devosia sp. CN2-171 TaxID=3400909 RepID=UPI003BF85265